MILFAIAIDFGSNGHTAAVHRLTTEHPIDEGGRRHTPPEHALSATSADGSADRDTARIDLLDAAVTNSRAEGLSATSLN
jgi:hypothetical protein